EGRTLCCQAAAGWIHRIAASFPAGAFPGIFRVPAPKDPCVRPYDLSGAHHVAAAASTPPRRTVRSELPPTLSVWQIDPVTEIAFAKGQGGRSNARLFARFPGFGRLYSPRGAR